MNDKENLQTIIVIPFKTFKEKIRITKEYEKVAKMQIVDDKYIYLEWRK